MAGAYSRGAHTLNTMLVKTAHSVYNDGRVLPLEVDLPIMRKSYHKKSSSDMIRETVKLDAEEVKNKNLVGDNNGNCWIPHERTGIYYPKGQEKVMESVPSGAGKVVEINWFS